MIKKILLTVFGLFFLFLVYFFFYEPDYKGPISLTGKTLIFAHRGFGNYAPDNSLIGAKMAMENKMDGVDMDGQFTKDKELVIFHDLSVDRLTSSTGHISDKNLEEVLKLDLATKYGKGFKDAYVATFEEFIKTTLKKGVLMVELKVPGTKPTGIEERAIELIKKYDAFESIYLSSFNPLVLYRLKKIDPRVHTVFIFMDTNWNPELLAEIKKEDKVDLPFFLRKEVFRRAIRKIIKPDLLSVNHKVNQNTIDTLLRKKYPIFLWTPETKEEIKEVLNKKPYGVITDEPQLAKTLLENKAP